MDIEKLPISELVVAVVSILGTILGTRLLDRRKEKREALEHRRERIRSILTTLSELEDDIQALEADLESIDIGMPHVARFIAPLIQDAIDLDREKIMNWQSSFEDALSAIKTLDVALYMRLLEEKRDFKGFFQRVLLPYLEVHRPSQQGKPELITLAVKGFLRELRATILEISKELPRAEQAGVIEALGPIEVESTDDDKLKSEVIELIATAIQIPMEKPLVKEDLEAFEQQMENPAIALIANRLSEVIAHVPGIFEKILFGNIGSMIAPILADKPDVLSEWLSMDEGKEEEIEEMIASFKFTPEEEQLFVGNRGFGRLVIGVARRFGIVIPYRYIRFLVALEKGWVSANDLIVFWRDNRVPIISYDRIQSIPILPAGYSKEIGSSGYYEFYQEQQARLENHADRIFWHPLSAEDIQRSEANLGYPLPPYFRDFLAVFGVKQDILPWLLWVDGSFFIATSLVPDNAAGRFFTIGRMTGLGHYFISFSDPNDVRVFHLDFEPEKQLVEVGEFPELLRQGIDEALQDYDSRRLNAEKMRKVEFHFHSSDYDQVISPLLELIQGDELPVFTFDGIANDVATWKADLRIADRSITMLKQEGFDENSFPRYFLELTEPVTALKGHSVVELVRECYRLREIRIQFLEYDFRTQRD